MKEFDVEIHAPGRTPEPKDPGLDEQYFQQCIEMDHPPDSEFYNVTSVLFEEARLPDRSTIVDVGCGIGRLAYNYANFIRSNRIIGIDKSPKAIEIAKSKFKAPNLEYMVGDVYDLTNLVGNADLVTVKGALHHFDYLGKAIDQLVGILSPKGTLFIQDFDRRMTESFINTSIVEIPKQETQRICDIILGHSPDDSLKLLRQKGHLQHKETLTIISILAAYTSKEVAQALIEKGAHPYRIGHPVNRHASYTVFARRFGHVRKLLRKLKII